MSIKKIQKIKNVGRFSNYNAVGELSFSENTIIFGENTNGKSTLTAIFRSLKNGDNNFLDDRKTFGSTENQKVKILSDSINKEYKRGSWKEKNIEIFDNDFIKDNVFDSDSIGDEQKSGLYSIFIGSSNRMLAKEITTLKKEQTVFETNRDKIKNDNFKELIIFKDFIELKEILGIDVKISKKEKEIIQQDNLAKIKTALDKTFLKNNFVDFKNNFKKTIDTSVEKLISNHIKNTWNDKNNSDNILGEGIKLLKKEEKKCIFCGQNFETKESKKLIDAFKEKFSSDYDFFKNIIQEEGDKFLNIDFEKEKLIFENLGIDIYLSKKLLDAKKKINKEIEKKQKDLNLPIDFGENEDFKIFESEFKKIKKYIVKTEKEISDSVDILILKRDLLNLKINKKRFGSITKKWVKLFNEEEKKIIEKKKIVTEKTEELAKNVNKIFEDNKKNINVFLGQLYADFRINKFESKKDLKRKNPHYCEYNFIFDEYEVENDKFKITFSDSDKRLLAFAMFLSKLKNDENLENKIIILDDPFSSFDENRRKESVYCLRDIKNKNNKKPKQKIILTHDRNFLIVASGELENVKNLKIHKDNSGSSIISLDINSFKKSQYFKDLEYIKNASGNSVDLDEALPKTRKCMEYILKGKYYFYLTSDTLKTKSVNKYIEEIGDDNLLFNKQELYDLKLHEDMHDSSQRFSPLSSDTEKVNGLKKFLKFIKKV